MLVYTYICIQISDKSIQIPVKVQKRVGTGWLQTAKVCNWYWSLPVEGSQNNCNAINSIPAPNWMDPCPNQQVDIPAGALHLATVAASSFSQQPASHAQRMHLLVQNSSSTSHPPFRDMHPNRIDIPYILCLSNMFLELLNDSTPNRLGRSLGNKKIDSRIKVLQ